MSLKENMFKKKDSKNYLGIYTHPLVYTQVSALQVYVCAEIYFCPKLGISNDNTWELSSQCDSNVGLLIMPMLQTIPRNASISSRVTGIKFRNQEWLPKMRGGLLFMAICCFVFFVSVTRHYWSQKLLTFPKRHCV